MNKKQIVVIGLKDRVILVFIFGTCITWMIATKERLTSPVADKMIKDRISLDAVSVFVQRDLGGNKLWI